VKRVFISDCEGPISKNDNAFETLSHFVPDGDKIFTVVSRYDDALADAMKRQDYNAGATLKLVLPFLKAYGVTDQKIKRFSARSLVLIANVKDSLHYVRSIAPVYIVSTSYEHYIKVLCQALEFPFKNTYCTTLSLDRYSITPDERTRLKDIAHEIAQMPVFEIPAQTKKLADLPENAQTTIRRLDEIFWKNIARMDIGKIYSHINPVGGREKAEATKDVVHKLNVTLADVMYVGDSITDEEALKLVKTNGGLAVSFNGNQYAVRNADVALLSADSMPTAVIGDIFIRLGKTETLNLVANWSRETLRKSPVTQNLLNRFLKLHPHVLPKAKITTRKNMENLAKESSEFRNKIRGEAVGRLG